MTKGNAYTHVGTGGKLKSDHNRKPEDVANNALCWQVINACIHFQLNLLDKYLHHVCKFIVHHQ